MRDGFPTPELRPVRPSPVRRVDGYHRLEDLGLVGDGATAALVGRDGTIPWLPVPRFDAAPVLCGLLDRRHGGAFTVAPEPLVAARQAYVPDTGVLVTELHGPGGVLRLTDALALRADADLDVDVEAGRRQLVRHAVCVEGEVDVRVAIDLLGGGSARTTTRGGLVLRSPARPELPLVLASTVPLPGPDARIRLRAGEALCLALRWGDGDLDRPPDPAALGETAEVWRRWARCIRYQGPRPELVRRSALTLKLLDHLENGAIVAAPTSSLPEAIGGVRNWDYRYAWVRDAAFSVFALRRIGLVHESRDFVAWALEIVEREGEPRVLYALDGGPPPEERIDPRLEGYRASAPVRWGNGAGAQTQNDVHGELVDCAFQWSEHGGRIGPRLWERIAARAEAARRSWREPDHGIWEVRTPGRPFTYSVALCGVALDRAARIARRHGLAGDVAGWEAEADRIRAAVREEAWNAELGAIAGQLGGDALDASALALPLRRVIAPGDERMVRTVAAIRRHLGAGDGLLHRYLPDEQPDGLPGHEGAFLLCSFWLVELLALQGRLAEAAELFGGLAERASPLGLLPEEIEPGTGAFLGNFPQAFSHVGVIAAGVTLARRGLRAGGPRPPAG